MWKIGVDAISVERMAVALDRSGAGFLKRVFTAAEIQQCGNAPERLAGRWAAKEAVIKAFDGTGVWFPRRRIEIINRPSGAPMVNLLGDAQGLKVEVSISHDHGLAIATAIILSDGFTPELLPAPPAVLLPDRPLDGHKGTFGKVVVVAGSLGMTGAAYLAATGAARSGAGLIDLLVAESIYPILAAKCTEVMATPVPEVAPGAVGRVSHDAILRHMESARAAVVGPGLGRDTSTWRLINDLAFNAAIPMVLDADAINAVSDHHRHPRKLPANRVLTPHPGEMARLLRTTPKEIQSGREAAAVEAAQAWNAVIVLKGSRTVVADPGGRVSVDPHQEPALASGGTGDVLSGLIAGLIAQGSEAFTAAVTAVYVHAATGRRLAERIGDAGVLASDLLPEIPVVISALRKGGL
ncbi:MAG TPA: NAD(P)H-hydrate dehydratase [Candidatus Dormibacteraeota bacterium]|jgi:NAD(P)H-hydrate epimerase|nr:NAD(P)H-hydrate dehydratase [Candidatus Dormibacteraeota bacterium]